MLVNSVARNFCRLLALVVAVRRLTSSRSTDAGWCFTACTVQLIDVVYAPKVPPEPPCDWPDEQVFARTRKECGLLLHWTHVLVADTLHAVRYSKHAWSIVWLGPHRGWHRHLERAPREGDRHAVALVLRCVLEAELRVRRDDRDLAQVLEHLQLSSCHAQSMGLCRGVVAALGDGANAFLSCCMVALHCGVQKMLQMNGFSQIAPPSAQRLAS